MFGGIGQLCVDANAFVAGRDALKFNAFKLKHMHGNVAEWVLDCWSDNYGSKTVEMKRDASIRLSTCLMGDEVGRFLGVVRGGDWSSAAHDVRSSSRRSQDGGRRLDTVGFRVVRVHD